MKTHADEPLSQLQKKSTVGSMSRVIKMVVAGIAGITYVLFMPMDARGQSEQQGETATAAGAVKKKKKKTQHVKVRHERESGGQAAADEVREKMLTFMTSKPDKYRAPWDAEVSRHLNDVQEGLEKISDYDYLKPIVRYLIAGGDCDRKTGELIRGLIELGAPTTSVGTPLHIACLLADEKEIRKQLGRKVDVNATCPYPAFPDEELGKRRGSILFPPITPTDFLFRIHPDRLDLIKLLLRRGAKPPVDGSFSNAVQSILRRAKTAEEVERQLPLMELLLKSGVSPEGLFGHSNTQIPFALWYACKLGSPGAVQMLIKYGADAKFRVTTPSAMYSEPYLHAACGDTPDRLEVLKILLKAGANPDTQNDKGQTAVEYAESQGLTKAAELLRGR